MKKWKDYYLKDISRFGSVRPERYVRQFLKFFRKCQFSSNKFVLILNKLIFRRIKSKRFIEIDAKTAIGEGLYIGHAYNITINPKARIGKNCNIHKGVLIGQENRGKRKGVPTIGNNVWIGINASIVGNVNIGDDVIIAPNSFVNCDVPSHSVVFGNPCIIKACEDATSFYINNEVK